MKRFICMFFVVIMCLGFVGCKEEESSPPAKLDERLPYSGAAFLQENFCKFRYFFWSKVSL